MLYRRAGIGPGIAARGRDREPSQIMRPPLAMGDTLLLVRQAAMGHPHQSAAVAIDQIDLDQARSRRHYLAVLPAETVGEAMDRHDFAECAARGSAASADALDKIKTARLRLGVRLHPHPAQS